MNVMHGHIQVDTNGRLPRREHIMDWTQFTNFMKLKWRVIAISLVVVIIALIIAVMVIGIFVLPAEITSSSGAITYNSPTGV